MLTVFLKTMASDSTDENTRSSPIRLALKFLLLCDADNDPK